MSEVACEAASADSSDVVCYEPRCVVGSLDGSRLRKRSKFETIVLLQAPLRWRGAEAVDRLDATWARSFRRWRCLI